MQEVEFINDVIVDVLEKNKVASYLIQVVRNIPFEAKVNIFRYKQSLDDPTLLFWRPANIGQEWLLMYFLKLE